MVNEHDAELDTIEKLRKETKQLREIIDAKDAELVRVNARVAVLELAILKVPELIRYPWDWMQCIFCGGKRGHNPGCIRDELGADAEK